MLLIFGFALYPAFLRGSVCIWGRIDNDRDTRVWKLVGPPQRYLVMAHLDPNIDPEQGDVKEKTEVLQIEHVQTNDESEDTIDVENKRAVKGDDSDGLIDWNWKLRIAVMCLIGLYTGELSSEIHFRPLYANH